jgi:RNA polymerase sigma factor (sigma-70 family)
VALPHRRQPGAQPLALVEAPPPRPHGLARRARSHDGSDAPLSAGLAGERGRSTPSSRRWRASASGRCTGALQSLSRPYREVIVLRDIEGLSYEEVAVALDLNVGTVKSRLSRGRNELRRRLEGSL